MSEAATTVKTSEMELKHMIKWLEDKEKTQNKDDAAYRTNKANMEKKQHEIKAIEV